jgi:hypothetical protein
MTTYSDILPSFWQIFFVLTGPCVIRNSNFLLMVSPSSATLFVQSKMADGNSNPRRRKLALEEGNRGMHPHLF